MGSARQAYEEREKGMYKESIQDKGMYEESTQVSVAVLHSQTRPCRPLSATVEVRQYDFFSITATHV